MSFPYITEIAQQTPTKIVLLVADGLGGFPNESGKSELETAKTPHLDTLAAESALGLTIPAYPGITVGSGAGHLALFGYDPLKYLIKRGVMEALGTGIELDKGEVAARGNFCTVDASGNITDRRAGRIPTEESAPLAERLNAAKLDGAKVKVYPVKDHRFVAVFSGEGLLDEVSDSDPQREGKPPLEVRALAPGSEKMAKVANQFSKQVRELLAKEKRANMGLVRGFSMMPKVPSMAEQFLLNPACISAYPMYRGLSRIVGMKILNGGNSFREELAALKRHWAEHDFFFIHYKYTDSAGEDGDFARKVKMIEEFDAYLPEVLALKPDVLVITGDHSTPSVLKAHSWHPVPILLHGKYSGKDGIAKFTERNCAKGSLGQFPGSASLVLAMANAFKLNKFGA